METKPAGGNVYSEQKINYNNLLLKDDKTERMRILC
jgi:hypothetical protein